MQVSSQKQIARRLPVGAEPLPEGGVHFRLWAPKPRQIELVLVPEFATPADGLRVELKRESNGYVSCTSEQAKPGMRYGFRLNNEQRILPDPASRFQPDGPGGLSQIVDADSFAWSDQKWPGIGPTGQVIYEMHIGTFTAEGTFAAAARELTELKRIGITMVEVMPVADFPGRFGWGYDGVSMFAPTRLYGQPDDFRRFVDRAHAEGLGVILDVVYNHFGNVDNYLSEFSEGFKSKSHHTEWAAAINFDGRDSTPVREFFVSNARYWIDEFHLDGFRYDATQSVFDDSRVHILAACNRAAREVAAAHDRQIYLVCENEPEDVKMVRPFDEGGYGMDAIWNDDFHHSAHVRLTGTNPAYYSDFLGTVEELAAAIKRGFIYQGQQSTWQKKRRGTPTLGLPARVFVSFLQNHDQVSNSPTGERIYPLTSPGRYRAMAALWLLAPQTPLFFQGQEFGASSPFLYFADFTGEMATAVAQGRAKFLSQFPNLKSAEAQRNLPNPSDPAVYESCKLDLTERETHRTIYDLHIDLLKLRREDPIFSRQWADRLDAAVLSPDCLAVRHFDEACDDRLLLINFGCDLHLSRIAEPLLAPPAGCSWKLFWNSNDARYGGPGTTPVETDNGWFIAGEACIVLRRNPLEECPSTAAHNGSPISKEAVK